MKYEREIMVGEEKFRKFTIRMGVNKSLPHFDFRYRAYSNDIRRARLAISQVFEEEMKMEFFP